MFHIFRNERRGSALWLDSANNFQEAESKAKKFYAEQQAEYFAFDGYTQSRFVFTLEQLAYQMSKRQRPVTVCLVCGKLGYDIGVANGPCKRIHDRKRCRGVNSSALHLNDWAKCPVCKAEGGRDGHICERCDDAGWLFVRDRPWVLGN